METGSSNLTLATDSHDHVTSPDVDDPYTPHESHEWIQLDRWAECTVCGVRDYWPGAGAECSRVSRKARKEPVPVTLAEALEHLAADLQRFGEWWEERAASLGLERPSLDEFFAEFSEWRRIGTANY